MELKCVSLGPVVVSILLIFRTTNIRILTGILQTRAKKHTAAQTTNNVEEKSTSGEGGY